ncbi:MAG: MFS transporter [Actinomycetota bacterium]|nr:MFS transporter [Actinomycetota bacterium]
MTDTDTAHGAGTAVRGARRAAHPALILLVIAGAQMMVVLDGTIVNIALPSMGNYFSKSQTSMTWALNAYTLAFGGLLLLGGRAGDIFGRRRMFMIGLGLFTLGSFLGGIATSFEFLIIGRIVQGIGGAIASPTALSLITTSFEEGKERTRAFAVYAAVSGAGAALGLLLGGILTEYLSWRWVLFVNVPIGVVLIAGGFAYLHESERHEGRFDLLGGVLSTVGMVGIVYGFIHAATDGWRSSVTLVTLIGGVVLLIVFFGYQAKARDPMLPLRVVLDRNRGGAYLVMLIVGAGMFGMFYFVTFFVQGVMLFSPLRAGFAFLPVAFVIGITSGVMTKLLPRYGPKPLIIAGTVLLTAAMFWYARVDRHSGYLNMFLPGMIVMAIGMGCIFVPLTTVAVARVRNTDAGVASAMLNVGQQVGGSIGLSVLANAAATAARSAAVSHRADQARAFATLPRNLQPLVGKFLSGAGTRGPDQSQIAGFVKSLPQADQSTVSAYFTGPYRDLSSLIQAHASGMGFLTAAIFGVASIVVSIVLINIKKDEVPDAPPLEAMAA